MLSYFSPFRSSKAKQPSPEPEEEQDEDESVDAEDEEGAFALHGQSLAHVGDASFGEQEVSNALQRCAASQF